MHKALQRILVEESFFYPKKKEAPKIENNYIVNSLEALSYGPILFLRIPLKVIILRPKWANIIKFSNKISNLNFLVKQCFLNQ